MRADRLLSTLLLLQAHRRLTGRELAERLEVSERTVHRDMEALSAAGVPVFALRGSQGGWQLDENWRTQVPGLDEAELRALLMAQPRALGDVRLAAAAESALSKLMAALPVALRDRADSIRQRLYVDTAGWSGATENLAMLPAVQDAVARDRQLAFLYKEPRGEPAERVVHPLGLVAKGPAWYLFAGTPRGFRTYRVSRMQEARLLDAACERPPDFDLAAAWKASTRRFRDERPRFAATLRLEPGAAEFLKMWRIVPRGQNTQSADGEWITLSVQFENQDQGCFIVQGLAPRVDVLEPASLRHRVAANVEAMAERMRDGQ
jgi:predicted DNA-binding transcriptional regulator YafY